MKYPDLDIYRFRIRLKLNGDLVTPRYKGSLLRGIFAWSFRNTVCVTKQPVCEGCMLKQDCSYFKIFETELPVSHISYLRGIRKVPHPFVLNPPADDRLRISAGEILEIELVLFGSSVNLLPYYVYVFQNIGKTGLGFEKTGYTIEEFTNVHLDGESKILIPGSGDISLKFTPVKTSQIVENLPEKMEKITLDFVSPVRFQEEGKVIKQRDKITPKLVVLSTVRRYLALAGLFGPDGFVDGQPDFRFNDFHISENSLNYFEWGRYSNRQKTWLDMSGLTGSLTIEGNVGRILPWLLIGSQINIGKNTAFGLGKFDITKSQSHEVTESPSNWSSEVLNI